MYESGDVDEFFADVLQFGLEDFAHVRVLSLGWCGLPAGRMLPGLPS